MAAACGDTVADPDTPARCNPGDYSLIEPGLLTIATGDPVFPPWMMDQDPTSGEGFESALAYEIASRLGFEDDEVKWVRVAADEALSPGPKTFDFAVEQYTITEERAAVVDFSIPYYTVRYALVATPESAVSAVATLEELRGLELGTALDQDTLAFIDSVIQPSERPTFFDTTGAARAALDAGEIDALVYDLPAAHFITDVEMPDTEILAQIGDTPDPPDQYGVAFATASTLLECVDAALTVLQNDGTLAELERIWLADDGRIRTIARAPSPGDVTTTTAAG